MNDSPTDEVRAVRHRLAERFGNDLRRIVDDVQRQQRESGCASIRLPGRAPGPVINSSGQQAGGVGASVER